MKRSKLIRIKNPPNNISRVRFLSGEAAENLGNLGEVDFFAVIQALNSYKNTNND
tara:strand:+ start:26 stop:190 length:165 start_codon:yes stop_codon:yes gene_type:complete